MSRREEEDHLRRDRRDEDQVDLHFGSSPAASMAATRHRAERGGRLAGAGDAALADPVRWTITASLVSTIVDSSSLVRRRSGTVEPITPIMPAHGHCGMMDSVGRTSCVAERSRTTTSISEVGLRLKRRNPGRSASAAVVPVKSKAEIPKSPSTLRRRGCWTRCARRSSWLAFVFTSCLPTRIAFLIAFWRRSCRGRSGCSRRRRAAALAVLLPVVAGVDLLHHRLELRRAAGHRVLRRVRRESSGTALRDALGELQDDVRTNSAAHDDVATLSNRSRPSTLPTKLIRFVP